MLLQGVSLVETDMERAQRMPRDVGRRQTVAVDEYLLAHTGLRKKSRHRCTDGTAADDGHLAVLDQRIARRVISTVNPCAIDARNFAALDGPLLIGVDDSLRRHLRHVPEPAHHVATLGASQHHCCEGRAGLGVDLEKER